MLYVDGRVVGRGRAWARHAGAVVPLGDAADVAALEAAGGWDHVVVLGRAGATPEAATAAFATLDDLLEQSGPTLLFGTVELTGHFRTAYADAATAAGAVPAVSDRRDALLRALRAAMTGAPASAEALGPPMRVTVGLFGPAATRRVGRALAAAVVAGRWGAIQLAAAAADLLGPERLEAILALDGDEPEVAVGPLADQLAEVLGPFPEARRHALLVDLWAAVAAERTAAAEQERRTAWAITVAGTQPDDPSAWLRETLESELDSVAGGPVGLAFNRPNWYATHALDHACRNAMAALALVLLAIAERDGAFDEQLDALDPVLDRVDQWSGVPKWSGPAVRRVTTLRIEERNRRGRRPDPVDPGNLLWPPADRRTRLVGVGWEASAAVETVNDAVGWCRSTPDVPSGWWAALGWRPLLALDARRAVEHGGWSWRYWFAADNRPSLAERMAAGATVEDALDGLWLAQLADLIGDLAGTGPVAIQAEQDRFRFQSPGDPPRDALRPLRTSVAAAVGGAAQLVRLGAEHPRAPRSWDGLVDALLTVGEIGDAASAGGLPYPPELATLQRRPLAGTDFVVIVPGSAEEIIGWGTWMGNCIGSYVGEVKTGRSFVFALARDDGVVPVHNFELVPGDGYWVNELKARFNAESGPGVTQAVEALAEGIGAPTRPWPPRRRPGPRHPRGGGGGRAADRARRPALTAAIETASAAVLDTREWDPLVRLGAAVGATATTVQAAATSVGRAAADALTDAIAVDLDHGIASHWSWLAVDWIDTVTAALPPDVAGLPEVVRRLRRDPRQGARRRRRAGATPATDTVRAVAQAATAVAGALGTLAEHDDPRLARAVAAEPGPATLGLLLVRSATTAESTDLAVPVDAGGLVATRPPTHALDPDGVWAAAWYVAGAARPAATARLWRRMAVGGARGELRVPPAWVGGRWDRWAARAARPLAGPAGGWHGQAERLEHLARDPATPLATLDALAARRADLAALVAINPGAAGKLRRRLSRHVDPLVAATACLVDAGRGEAAAWCAGAVTGTLATVPAGDWPDALPSGLQVRLGAALAGSPTPGVAAIAARMARQPPVLEALAGHADPAVRAIVAAQPATPRAMAVLLAEDDDADVRAAVAGRSGRLPPATLRRLGDDQRPVVRAAIAARTDTPIAVLERLARDRSSSVRKAAQTNPKLHPQREAAEAADPSTSHERLAALARSELPATRKALAANPKTPVETLALLAYLDPDPEVRATASAAGVTATRSV